MGGGLWLKLIFMNAQLVLTVLAGMDGPLSLLPLFAGVLFTWFIDVRSDVQLKAVIIGAQLLWAVYDLCYRNYVAFGFDILTIGANAMGIWLLLRQEAFRKKGK